MDTSAGDPITALWTDGRYSFSKQPDQGILPGAEILLSALNHFHARRAARALSLVWQHSDPHTLAPSFWLRLFTQLQAGLDTADLLKRQVW